MPIKLVIQSSRSQNTMPVFHPLITGVFSVDCFFEIYFYKNNAQIKQQTKRIIDKKGA
ncbi:hypothetical protein OM351_06980 [Escherichia albertii]|nr:hypothetical protein [Escherichia albertii]